MGTGWPERIDRDEVMNSIAPWTQQSAARVRFSPRGGRYSGSESMCQLAVRVLRGDGCAAEGLPEKSRVGMFRWLRNEGRSDSPRASCRNVLCAGPSRTQKRNSVADWLIVSFRETAESSRDYCMTPRPWPMRKITLTKGRDHGESVWKRPVRNPRLEDVSRMAPT